MVDRVGDWYAFSRTSFCRRLTLYEDLPWRQPTSAFLPELAADGGNAGTSPSFSLASAELVAVAPFGGPVAVLSHTADFTSSPSSFALDGQGPASPSSPDGSARPYFNLSAHSAATRAASQSIHVFTNAGELLASFPLTPQDVGRGTVKTLGWTPEGELLCLLEPSLTVVFIDTRDMAVEVAGPSPALMPQESKKTIVTRRVPLKPRSDAAATAGPTPLPRSSSNISTATSSSSSSSALAAFCVTTDGLLCVDGDGSGQLYGLLHEEKFCSSVVPSVRLPLHGAATRPPRVTAVDMVPPTWNDSGDFVVLWTQHEEVVEDKSAKGKGDPTKAGVREADVVSSLCAMVLPGGDLLDDGAAFDASATTEGRVVSRGSTWPAARMACSGRVLSLHVCGSDATRAAVFTTLGVLHVFRSNLSCLLYSIDLGLCRVLRDMAVQAANTTDGDDGYYGGALTSQSFAFGDVPWRQRDLDVGSNASFGVGGGTTGTADDGTGLAHSPLGGSSSLLPSAGDGGGTGGDSALRAVACPPPYKLEWCGSSFVLLHFYQADFQLPCGGFGLQRRDAPMFSLLVCTQKDCSVHCERLDWSLDGSGHVATVAEEDGVRVLTDTTCYFLQVVPSCLAKLCRVQPPFSAAAQVVLAYQAYTNGDRHGIAQVRAALSSSTAAEPVQADEDAEDDDDDGEEGNDSDEAAEMSYAEGIVYELLDAASYEFDMDQQYRLIAAASFAGETIHLRSGVPDVIVDVVRRLRVLRAVRVEPYCHLPLTMGQYQLLIGSEERPARLLSSSEGSVLVDRLTYMGYYQLALDVVRALHMKPNRVLSRWASSFVRRHAARLSDIALHHEVAQVLKQYPAASYVEPATTAFQLGRRDLALRLLRDEPQQQRQRVMLCVKMGEVTMAGRAAAASGSAELVHLVVCALVAKEAQSHARQTAIAATAQRKQRNEHVERETEEEEAGAEGDSAAAGITTEDVYHCLIASPELLCWLLVGAQCLASWHSMAQRLLLTRHWSLASLECQHVLVQCLRRTTAMHRAQLQQYVAETAGRSKKEADSTADAQDPPPPPTKSKKDGKRSKSKRKHHHHGDDDDGDDDASGSEGRADADSDDDGDTGRDAATASKSPGATATTTAAAAAALSLPPPLSIPVPTALSAAAALTEWLQKTKETLLSDLQQAEALRRSKTAGRYPFSVVLEKAEQLRVVLSKRAAVQDSDDETQESMQRNRTAAARLGEREESSETSGASSSVFAQERCVHTILSTPSTFPLKDLDALKKEQDLSKLKVSLAVKHNSPRLSRVVSVVDLIYELYGLEDGEADAADVQRVFKVNEKMFFYAKLRGMCAAQRWAAVDRFLGPAPPLRKRSFFAVSDGAAAKPPCIGYLAVVHLLMSHKQEERAARYVAGACSEALDRVVLYMSLGAPVMALEAAMVEKDAGLIQQIMQRVPGSAKVQSVGTQMLNELRED